MIYSKIVRICLMIQAKSSFNTIVNLLKSDQILYLRNYMKSELENNAYNSNRTWAILLCELFKPIAGHSEWDKTWTLG